MSRSWPVGLVEDVDIKDPGLLHTIDDKVYALDPGRIDLSDPLLCRLNYEKVSTDIEDEVNFTFIENLEDELVQQSTDNVAYVGDRTHGPDGIFYDDVQNVKCTILCGLRMKFTGINTGKKKILPTHVISVSKVLSITIINY